MYRTIRSPRVWFCVVTIFYTMVGVLSLFFWSVALRIITYPAPFTREAECAAVRNLYQIQFVLPPHLWGGCHFSTEKWLREFLQFEIPFFTPSVSLRSTAPSERERILFYSFAVIRKLKFTSHTVGRELFPCYGKCLQSRQKGAGIRENLLPPR